MATSGIMAADSINHDDFQKALQRYSHCIESISAAKGAKKGQKSLAELDQYRYQEAVEAFGNGKSGRLMTLDDVKSLVEWKLRHGTFRPSLMKLVSSNDAATVQSTIQEAIAAHRSTGTPRPAEALRILTRLKGVGPATASLLLAVHDPDAVVFFADEAFHWLCCGGKSSPIRYDAKEYQALHERAAALMARLGVRAVDVERVAFVLMRDRHSPVPHDGPRVEAHMDETAKGRPAKRKQAVEEDANSRGPKTRSKRGKKS